MKKSVIAFSGALAVVAIVGTSIQAQSSNDTTAAKQAPQQIAWGGHKKKSQDASETRTERATAREGGSGESAKAVWNDVPTGFALAKKQHKPIITDFYTDWCGWCKVMEKKTFENPDVEKLMADNFVLVRANAEDHGSGQHLSQANRIDGYPTIIIFDESGTPRATMVGYQKAEPFMDKLHAFLAGKPIPADQ
ncbi:MAG TPA: thioredoxin family protein [Candidatus Obscuribacterales bacterium]